MASKGRTYTTAKRTIEPGRMYSPLEGVRLLKTLDGAKFDETVEVHFRLGVDVRHADQIVRGTTVLPHGTGKEMRVAVFAEGDKAREAEEAGADIVGSDDLAKQIQDGVFNFDIAIATPERLRDSILSTVAFSAIFCSISRATICSTFSAVAPGQLAMASATRTAIVGSLALGILR